MADGSIFIDTQLDQSGLRKGLATLGTTVIKGIKAALAGATASLVAGSAAAVKYGSEFESAFAGVKKTVDATDEELSKLRKGILDMSESIPSTASDIAGVAEAAGQLGIETDNILSFTETMVNLGVATDLSSNEAASSLARLANITGMPQTEFDRLGSTVVALGNNLATTESQIVRMSLRLAGTGKQVGMSEDQILALSGALSSVGLEAEAGGSAMSRTLSMMQLACENGGESLEALAKVSGMTSNEFKQSFEKDATKALMAFLKGLNDTEKNGKSAIGVISELGDITELSAMDTIAVRDALLRASSASDLMANSLEIASTAWEENTALTKEAEQRYETLDSKVILLQNSAKNLGIAVYENLQNPLKDAIVEAQNYVNRLHEAFDKNGFEGLIDEAGSIFGEIAVKVAECAPQMVDAAISFLQSFINGIIANSGKLLEAAKKIVWTLVDGLVKLLPKEVQKPVKETVNTIKKSFESGGLRSAINTAINILKNLGKVITNIAKVILPPMAKAVDFLAGKMKYLIPLVASAVAAYKAYSIIKGITAFIQAHTAAVTAESLATAASTGAISLKQIAVGVLTGQITLATAAQYAWNLAMSMNPIGAIIAAVAALAIGIGALVMTMGQAEDETDDLRKAQERLDAANEALGTSYSEIGGKISEFLGNIDNAGSIFDNFNEKILISDEEKQALSDNMDSVQSEITEICRLAAEKRGELTEGEVKRLDELFEKMHSLSEQELALEQSKQSVVTSQAEALNNAAGISLDEYTQRAQTLTNTAEQTRTAVIDKAYEQYTEEVALLDLRLETDKNYSQKEHDDAVAAADKKYQSAIAAANKEASDTLAIIQKGYLDRAEAISSGNKTLSDLKTQEEAETKQNTDNLAKIQSDYSREIDNLKYKQLNNTEFIFARQEIFNKRDKALAEENTRHKTEQARIAEERQKVYGDKNYQNQLSGFMALEALYETYAGKTNEQAKSIVDSFFDPMENMDEETKNTFSEAMKGALDGLESKKMSLFYKADEIADGFISRFRRIFDIHSPSKVFKKLFGYTIEGAEIGTENEAKKLYKAADDIASEFKERIEPDVDFASIASDMRGAVRKTTNEFGRVVSERSASDNYRRGEQRDKDGNHRGDSKPEYVENNIYIDGRKSARVITPYVAKELEWEGKR